MSTTEDETLDDNRPDDDPCGRTGLPRKLSRLRAKLNRKAKQDGCVCPTVKRLVDRRVREIRTHGGTREEERCSSSTLP